MPKYTYKQALDDSIEKWTRYSRDSSSSKEQAIPSQLHLVNSCGLCHYHSNQGETFTKCDECLLKSCTHANSIYVHYKTAKREHYFKQSRVYARRILAILRVELIKHLAKAKVKAKANPSRSKPHTWNNPKFQVFKDAPKPYTFNASPSSPIDLLRIEKEVRKDDPNAPGFFIDAHGRICRYLYKDFLKAVEEANAPRRYSFALYASQETGIMGSKTMLTVHDFRLDEWMNNGLVIHRMAKELNFKAPKPKVEVTITPITF